MVERLHHGATRLKYIPPFYLNEMYVEVAEVDMEGFRSTIHEFDDVVAIDHERESEGNGWTARMYLTFGGGETETIVGRGYGLEVVRAELE